MSHPRADSRSLPAFAERPALLALDARFRVEVSSGAGSFIVKPELSLASGVLVLFGPSGSGKTLTLKAIAGLIRPRSGSIQAGGEILFDAERGVDVPAHKRRIGYVPQHSSIFPFASVTENIAFGLPRAERRGSPAILELMKEVGVSHLAGADPASLSGGERQRVALARALAVEPRLLMLDEPFASIDREGRVALRRMLKATLARRRTPAVFVTHDEDEAIELGDSLVLLEKGATIGAGSPASLLRRGRSVVVIGTMVGLPAELPDGRASVTLREAAIEAPADLLARLPPSGVESVESVESVEGASGAGAKLRLELVER